MLEAGNHLRKAFWLHIPPYSVLDHECTRLHKSYSFTLLWYDYQCSVVSSATRDTTLQVLLPRQYLLVQLAADQLRVEAIADEQILELAHVADAELLHQVVVWHSLQHQGKWTILSSGANCHFRDTST